MIQWENNLRLRMFCKICDEHAQKSKCLDYRDQIIQLLENLMGSSAVVSWTARNKRWL